MPLGINSAQNVILPPGWDGEELRRVQLADGVSYEAIVADVDAALSIASAGLTNGYLAQMMYPTDMPGLEYRTGATAGFTPRTEYTQPDVQRGETTGHMLPHTVYDRKMGWTTAWLENARQPLIDADIAAMVADARNIFEQKALERHFSASEVTGRKHGLGATGISVPFVNGSVQAIGGSASSVPFTPVEVPMRQTAAFTSSHTHFLVLDGITQANLETAVKHVWEHGHDAPFELLISLADIASWQNTTNVTGFVERVDTLIQYGNATDLALVDRQYLGVVKTEYGPCRVYASGRVPTAYWSVFKSYGPLDMRNPLYCRIDPRFGLGVSLVVENVSLYPLTGAVGVHRFGFGVGMDRTVAVCVENDTTGTYANPTIS